MIRNELLLITDHGSLITDHELGIGRARWGASGVLHPQSAIAGLNSRSEALTFLRLAQASDDEGWVLRNLILLNPVRPGREQRQVTGECAAGKPGWSQLLEYRLEEQVEDQVHGLINVTSNA